MNIAIIGLGKIADYHINALRKNGINIVGGTDLNPAAGSKLPKGAKFYTNTQELLAYDSIDTVLLLVPSGEAKLELSRDILNSGKHLITEKPAVRSIQELNELKELAINNNVSIHGAFHSRFSPTARFIYDKIHGNEYAGAEIAKVEIWADSPHIIDWKVVGSSSEDTSFHAEGPNILAEALLYADDIKINASNFIGYDDSLPEVYTRITGTSNSASFEGTTSWVRGIKQKGVRITFKDGRQLIGIHTDQKVYDENGTILFDGMKFDSETSRMQKEYDKLYEELLKSTDGTLNNTEIIESVVTLMDQSNEISKEIGREGVGELNIK